MRSKFASVRIDIGASLLLVLGAVTATYANHFQNGFHIDDWHTIVQNPAIRSLANVPEFFLDARTSSVLPANQMYRPIVTTATAIDYALARGYTPLWFHVSTFLLFLAQLVAMFFLYRHVIERTHGSRPIWLATIAVAWYGLHPAIAETVNYIIQRADLYCTCGVVFSIALYACRPTWRRSCIYLIPAAFALLSKPPAAALPLLLCTYILLFERDSRAPLRETLRRSLPAFALTIGALILSHVMTPKTFAPIADDGRSFLITQPFVLMRFAASAIAPAHLNPDSAIEPLIWTSAQALAGDAFVLALIACAFAFSRTASLRPAAFGLFWFLLAAMPAAVFPVSQIENDHRMYFPFVGLLFTIVWIVSMISMRLFSSIGMPPRAVVAVAVVLVLGSYALGTVARNRVWLDDRSMWYDAMQRQPTRDHIMNYGLTEMAIGSFDRARDAFARAERIDPTYPTLQINEAILANAVGDTRAVGEHYARAVAYGKNDAVVLFFYAKWLRDTCALRASQREAARAVVLDPTSLDKRTLLLHDDIDLGDVSAAGIVARQTLVLMPQDLDARTYASASVAERSRYWIDLSFAAAGLGRFDEERERARCALTIDPQSAAAYTNVGAADASERRWDDAIANDERALSLQSSTLARNNLAWALQERARARNHPLALKGSR